MTGVKFFKDANNARSGWNGLAAFTDKPVRGKGTYSDDTKGFKAVVAKCDGAGDGPYALKKVSQEYLEDCCKEITPAQARKQFPKLVAEVEKSLKA